MPKVSVCLTSYNHERFLAESIESILAQTYKDYELFIVDDCSTDNSWDIIRIYAEKDKRIHPIRHEFNWGGSGFSKMLSGLLGKMRGQYVAIAHCDDKWESTKLEKQVEVLENQKVSACFTQVKVINDNGEVLEDKKHPYYKTFEQHNRSRYEWLNYFFNKGNCLCHPSILIEKTAYSEYKILSKGLDSYPDFCQWIRLCKHDDIYILQEQLTCFRVHSDESNTSGNNFNNIKRLSVEEMLVLEEFLSLADTDELVSVFPEAEKYVINGEIVGKFALAKLMLKVPKHSYHLAGLKLLYNLLQEDASAEKVKRLYSYTLKDYNREKQKHDIFHVIADEKYMQCSLYFNGGAGYSEKLKTVQEILVQPSGKFNLKVGLSVFEKEVFSNGIRLDLDEGRYRRFKNIQITCNSQKVECRIINGCKEGEWDVFYTLDPQYELVGVDKGCLEISGSTELLEGINIENHFNTLRDHSEKLEDHCKELEHKISIIENDRLWKACRKIKKIIGR